MNFNSCCLSLSLYVQWCEISNLFKKKSYYGLNTIIPYIYVYIQHSAEKKNTENRKEKEKLFFLFREKFTPKQFQQ